MIGSRRATPAAQPTHAIDIPPERRTDGLSARVRALARDWRARADRLVSASGELERAIPARSQTAALVGACVVALAVRVWLLTTTDFPINDGGLFARFVDAVAAQFPRLPAWAPFNGYNLPFAYPPLSFWLAAGGVKLGASTLGILHVAPILMNMGYVLLFALLLVRMGYSRLFTAVALLIFATSFRSFEWLVMGGGLSRGLGSLFALLCLLALNRPQRAQPRPAELVAAGVCVAGAVLSHLEWGLLTAASSLLSLALTARSLRMWIAQCLAVGLIAVVLVLPWVLFVYRQHGMAPFFAASQTSDWYNGWRSGPFWRAYWITKAQNGPMLPFAILGGLGLLLQRRPFWIGFLVFCLFLTPRQGPTPAALGFGVLSAAGFFMAVAVVGAVLRRPALSAALVGVALVITAAARNQWSLRPDPAFHPLTVPERSAMAWITRYQPQASFAVITKPAWEYDRTAEWLPYLAGVRSTTTVQGTEWLPGGAFRQARKASGILKEATQKSCPRLLAAMRLFPPADYVLTEQRPACFRAAGYRLSYANEDVSIWQAPPRS